MRLEGKVALVTGASSGIGYSIAEKFGDEGASVCLVAHRHLEQAQELADKIEGNGGRRNCGPGRSVQTPRIFRAWSTRLSSDSAGLTFW